MNLYDHYLISVPEIYDSLESNGIIGRNTVWYIDQERDRYARKVTKGIVIAKPHAYTNTNHYPIDPGIPNYRIHMGHDQIQAMHNIGRKQLPPYYPSVVEQIDFVSLADIGAMVDVEVGETVYFHPNLTEPENEHAEGVYKALPDQLIYSGGRMQAGWVLVEPIIEESVVDGFILSVEPGSKMLEGIIRNIRNRTDLKAGDRVMFQEDSNWEYVVEGVTYFAMKEENIWMKKVICDICDGNDKPLYKMCDKHWSEYQQWIKQSIDSLPPR